MLFRDCQRTIAQSIQCEGIGLHSGAPVVMVLHPAEIDTGIRFFRKDALPGQEVVPVLWDKVVDTRLGTTIANEHGTSVSTIEHLMAAIWGCGIDNMLIELDGPEVPIMDGSSAPFVFQIETANIRRQTAPRKAIRVKKTVRAASGESEMVLEPFDGYAIDIAIEFAHEAIARQTATYNFERITFKQMLSRARTFGFEKEVEMLRSMGLARGGSLNNAIVIGENGVLNREGLRFNDEFVRHKALDAVGDLYLAGAPLLARVKANRPGHGVNNLVLRALFADESAYEWVELKEKQGTSAHPSVGVSMGAGLSGALHE